MVENKKALENLDKILKVKNLDCVLIGPTSFCVLGIPGKFNDLKFKNALKFIKLSCKKNKMPCGLHLIS